MSEVVRISAQEARQKTTSGQAAKLANDGYTSVAAVKGGVEAWKAAGYPLVQ